MKKPSNLLYDDPFIASYEKIITQQECCQLIDLAKNQLEPSKVKGAVRLGYRKSYDTLLQHDSHEVVRQVCERIASIVKYPLNYAEQLKVIRYQVGGEFKPHYDHLNLTPLEKTTTSQSGHRIITAFIYLNNVSLGGETFFPTLDIKVAPSQGTLLVIENHKEDSKHGGCPVKEEEKWIAALWFHEKSQY